MSRSSLTSLFVATVILFGAMGLMLVGPAPGGPRHIGATFTLGLALAISCWQLIMAAVAPRPAAASMMVHLFFVFFLIVPALFQLATQTYALDMSVYTEETAMVAAILVLLFVICFVVGNMLGPKDLGRAMQTIKACERRRRSTIVIGFVLLAAVVAVVAIMDFGVDTLVTNRSTVSDYTAAEETKASAGLSLDLPRAITFCAVVAILYLLGRKTGQVGGNRRTIVILLALLIFPLFAVINYPLSLARFWLLGMILAVLFMYIDLRKIRTRLLLIAGIGGSVYTLFPLLRTLTTADTIGPNMRVMTAREALFSGNFDGFEMIMNIVIVVDRFGHTLGHQLGSALLFFVPRAFWEGKARPSGYYTAETLGYSFTNLSAPTMGELYLDFSYVGVILGGLAIGYVYRKADTVFAAALAFGGVTMHRILVAMLCGFTIILMRGALLAVIALIATSFAVITALIAAPRVIGFFAGRKRRLRPG